MIVLRMTRIILLISLLLVTIKIIPAEQSQLFIAITNNDEKKAIQAINQGAKINTKNSDGKTPLMIAVEKNNLILTNMLLENKANPNLRDNNKQTALHYAVINKNPEIVKLLLLYDAKPTIKDTHNNTPLDYLMPAPSQKSQKSQKTQKTQKRCTQIIKHMGPENKKTPLITDDQQAIKALLQEYDSTQGTAAPNNLESVLFPLETINYAPINVPATDGNTFATRTLLFFIDDNEKSWPEALSNYFMHALMQKAGPIVVSTSLYNNIFFSNYNLYELQKNPAYKDTILSYIAARKKLAQYTMPQKTGPLNYIKDIVSKINLFLRLWLIIIKIGIKNPFDIATLKSGLILAEFDFDPSEWRVFAINEQMRLMIPAHYYNAYAREATKHRCSIDEIAGLKISTLKPVPDDEFVYFIQTKDGMPDRNHQAIISSHQSREQTHGHFNPSTYCNKQLLETLFITNNEYNNKKTPIHLRARWGLYVMGHGSIDQAIVGLPLPTFIDILNFFNNSINTKFLTYNSCFAAGTNEKTIYGTLYKDTLRVPFPVITTALTDTNVYVIKRDPTIVPGAIDWKKGKINTLYIAQRYKLIPRFDLYVNALTTKTWFDYEAILAAVIKTQLAPKFGLIRFPGTEWFSITDTEKNTVPLHQKLANTHTGPLPINTFFNTPNPKALLLYATYVPFPLIANNTFEIIPMAQGAYYLEELTIKNGSPNNLLTDFFATLEFNFGSITLIIKKLTVGKTIFNDVYVGNTYSTNILQPAIVLHKKNNVTYHYTPLVITYKNRPLNYKNHADLLLLDAYKTALEKASLLTSIPEQTPGYQERNATKKITDVLEKNYVNKHLKHAYKNDCSIMYNASIKK